MHITGEVDVFDLDSWDVRYKGVALEPIIEELLERLGLVLAGPGEDTFLKDSDDA